uniref:Transmembrane protein n=1 Tax=Panagrellus redivivus TaxID=6233 RepID=A0A7E4UVF6_PANRE
MNRQTTVNNVRSSLPLQILLYISARLSIAYFIFMLVCYIVKLNHYASPLHLKITEIIILALFVPLESTRISFGTRGNLTETPSYLSFSILLSVSTLAICVYFAFFQANVLLAERVVSIVQGSLNLIEALISMATVAMLSRGNNPVE